MDIATVVFDLVGKLVSIGLDAYKSNQADAVAVLASMKAAIEDAQSQIRALPSALAANDKEADSMAATRPDEAVTAKLPTVEPAK